MPASGRTKTNGRIADYRGTVAGVGCVKGIITPFADVLTALRRASPPS